MPLPLIPIAIAAGAALLGTKTGRNVVRWTGSFIGEQLNDGFWNSKIKQAREDIQTLELDSFFGNMETGVSGIQGYTNATRTSFILDFNNNDNKLLPSYTLNSEDLQCDNAYGLIGWGEGKVSWLYPIIDGNPEQFIRKAVDTFCNAYTDKYSDLSDFEPQKIMTSVMIFNESKYESFDMKRVVLTYYYSLSAYYNREILKSF